MNSPGAMLWARDDVLRSVDRVRRAVSDQHELVGLQSTFVLEDAVPGGVSPEFRPAYMAPTSSVFHSGIRRAGQLDTSGGVSAEGIHKRKLYRSALLR